MTSPTTPTAPIIAPARRRHDVVIVGGGAAGLSAAVTLARSLRDVLVIDAGEPRNAPAAGAHNLLGREGISPLALLESGRQEAAAYGAKLRHGRATTARRTTNGFELTLADGDTVSARRVAPQPRRGSRHVLAERREGNGRARPGGVRRRERGDGPARNPRGDSAVREADHRSVVRCIAAGCAHSPMPDARATAAFAAPANPSAHPLVAGIVAEISPARIEARVRRLVAFGTRHTFFA